MENFFRHDGSDKIKLEMEVTFKDDVQRDFLDAKEYIQIREWKSLISRLCGYKFIKSALNETKEAVQKYLSLPEEEKPKIVGRALWSHAVVQYCKCYKTNEGWTVKLESSATIKNESPQIKEGHKWFMEQRDTFLVHGGESLAQQSFVFIVQRKALPNQIDGFLFHYLTAASPTNEALVGLDRLAEASIKYVMGNIYELERKICLFLLQSGKIVDIEILKRYGLDKTS